MSNVVAFPSPADVMRAGKLRFGYVWKHDLESVEFRDVGAQARCLYLALLVIVDANSQSATIGKTALGRLSGMDRANVRRAHRELQAAGLLQVTEDAISGGTKVTYYRNTYTLLCPPSTLRIDPRQVALPFRRLSYTESKEIRLRG